MRGVKYSLIFVNNSRNTWDACVYQKDPDLGVPNVQSLAWFAKRTAPTTRTVFQWTVDYSFIWSETGTLVPGVLFLASQVWLADLSTRNKVTFTKPGVFTFARQEAGPQAGTLYIDQDASIPPNVASVGIGMSGAGTFAAQAQPNIQARFTPHPKYWITFGHFMQGEVLDTGQITSRAAEIKFPHAVYSMTAILSEDHTWTVKRTSDVNRAFVAARHGNARVSWAGGGDGQDEEEGPGQENRPPGP